MKKTILALLVIGAVTMVAPRFVAAQSDPAVVKVPFQFIVGDRLMPAGTYRIASDPTDRTLITIEELGGKGASVFAETNWTGNSTEYGAKVNVQFKNVDGHYFLAEVAIPGDNVRAVTLTKADAERALARLNLMPIERGDAAK